MAEASQVGLPSLCVHDKQGAKPNLGRTNVQTNEEKRARRCVHFYVCFGSNRVDTAFLI